MDGYSRFARVAGALFAWGQYHGWGWQDPL